MKIISGFFVYQYYVLYKAHFSDINIDITKYNGPFRKKITYDTFIKNKNQHYYDSVAIKIKEKEKLKHLLIVAFVKDPYTWIGEINDDFMHLNQLREEWEGKIANMQYLFKKDCINMFDNGLKFDQDFGTNVFKSFNDGNIELETFIILRKIFNFSLDGIFEYDYLYKDKYLNYEQILNVDENKYKQILKEVIMTLRD
jgi:hypothetical protein